MGDTMALGIDGPIVEDKTMEDGIWESPEFEFLSKEPDTSDGRGLGIISQKAFEPSRWHPSRPELKEQYVKFVNLIVGRICANESNITEAQLLFKLLNTDGKPSFWTPVPRILPELEAGLMAASKDGNEPYLLLLAFLRIEVRVRERQGRERMHSDGVAALTGLPKSLQEALASTMFGRETAAANRTEGQNRFLKSFIEMGYPQHANADENEYEVMANDEAVASQWGRTIQRDSLGLPVDVGTAQSSAWPPEVQRAIDRDREERSKFQSSERREPMTVAREATPRGQKPPLRHHECSGYSEQLLQAKRQQQPRLAPVYKSQTARDALRIEGMDPAAYATVQAHVALADAEDIGQRLRQMDLHAAQGSTSTSQTPRGNEELDLCNERVTEASNNRDKGSEAAVEASKSGTKHHHGFPPTYQGFDLSRSIPDVSSAEVDRSILAASRATSSSGETLEFASQADHSPFLTGSSPATYSSDSTLQPGEGLLSQMLEGASSHNSELEVTTGQGLRARTQSNTAPSENTVKRHREDSELTADLLQPSSREILFRRERPSLQPRDGENDPSPASLEPAWYDRLP